MSTAARAVELRAEEEIYERLQRGPATVYTLLQPGLDEHAVRRILKYLEFHGEVVKCDPGGEWGANWWRLPGPEPPVPPLREGENVESGDLRHISAWARAAAARLGGEYEDLMTALDEADSDTGPRTVRLTARAASDLLGLDITAHGHGTNRALVSTRRNCERCKRIGIAMEELLPRLAVQRAKRQK